MRIVDAKPLLFRHFKKCMVLINNTYSGNYVDDTHKQNLPETNKKQIRQERVNCSVFHIYIYTLPFTPSIASTLPHSHLL